MMVVMMGLDQETIFLSTAGFGASFCVHL